MAGHLSPNDILHSVTWDSVKVTTRKRKFGQLVTGGLEHKQAKKKIRKIEKRAESLKKLKELYPAEKNLE
jgi:hypothetical protein